MTRQVEDLKRFAEHMRDMHDPAKQEGNNYERCMFCGYTRHPCEVNELATDVLKMLEDPLPNTE